MLEEYRIILNEFIESDKDRILIIDLPSVCIAQTLIYLAKNGKPCISSEVTNMYTRDSGTLFQLEDNLDCVDQYILAKISSLIFEGVNIELEFASEDHNNLKELEEYNEYIRNHKNERIEFNREFMILHLRLIRKLSKLSES